MPSDRPRPYLVPVLLLFSACATAPTAPRPVQAPAPVQAAASEPRKITLLCGDTARIADFAQLGVPSGERPIGVAVTGKSILVLFAPARLMRIVRLGDKIDVEMTIGHGDEQWSTLDVDPVDGSIWVALAQKPTLLHISPDWKREIIPLKKVVGEAGFSRLLAAEDALYVIPPGADKLVWRIDRTGKVLDTAFPAKKKPAEIAESSAGEAKELESNGVRLLRDREDHVLVWDESARKMFQADGKGGYVERTDLHWFDSAHGGGRAVKGLNVGGKEERWFLATGLQELFFWKGRPVFIGPMAMGGKEVFARVFYVPDDRGLGEYFETCRGLYVAQVATSASSYAAITEKAVLFGDVASAPDLP